MNKLKTLLLILISGVNLVNGNYSIVFIHLGKNLPKYLKYSISQARLFNPNSNIYIIAETDAYNNQKHEFADFDPIFVKIAELQPSVYHNIFNKNSLLDSKKSRGFWHFTTERFFYLSELVSQYNLKNVFHLENDVMLYADLSLLLPKFIKNYSGIAATFDNDTRVIPGFMYCADQKALKELVKFIATRSFSKENDMLTLARFKTSSNAEFIDSLPIIFPAYLSRYTLKSTSGLKAANSNVFTNHFEDMVSIFDAAAIGQYLGGIDPIHKNIFPEFINESCIFQPNHLNYEWIEDEFGRSVPYAVFNDKKIKINNLHIHSKNLKSFLSKKGTL